MVDTKAVARVVKSYLPQAEQEVVDRIISDVRQDAENIIHSLIRQAVAQEKDKLYRPKGGTVR